MPLHFFDAVIFDLDGVITKTAVTHSNAWKKMFDDYLHYRSEKYGEPFRAFTSDDYLRYVDGKPRYDGVQSFLASRKIDLPFGNPSDAPDRETVCGLGNRKNEAFNEVLKNEGVVVYPSTVSLLEELKGAGIRIGVASSSKNCEAVLKAAGLTRFVETRVDGIVSVEMGLKGKPEPDIFLTTAANLGVEPDKTVVVEDASSGVEAGKKGNFGMVLGLARENNTPALLAAGADVVVEDLENFHIRDIDLWFKEGLEQDNWMLKYHDYEPSKEKSREALLTVGNGYFGTRGAMEETHAGPHNYPGTYIAGLYNRLVTKVAGRDVENEDFVNAPNWLPVSFKIDDEPWFNPNDCEIVEMERSLDFRNGLLHRNLVVSDAEGRQTRIESWRFAGMDNCHLAGLRYRVTPLNYSGELSLFSAIDGSVKNEGVERYKALNPKHLETIEQGGDGQLSFLKVKTTQSSIEIAMAARLRLSVNGKEQQAAFGTTADEGVVYTYIDCQAHEGETIELQKVVGIYSSNQPHPGGDITQLALAAVNEAGSFDQLLEQSTRAWKKIWEKADIRLEGDRLSQKLLRLHIFHLMVSASPHNVGLDAGITARGLHGEAYRGHIFWDELFILPFYNIHFPEIARALLLYRYHRLDAARKYAAAHGYGGAMFPWQSGSSGREETQVVHLNPLTGEWGPDHSALQRHVSLAIAYNLWQYYNLTGDTGFMEDYGMEMFLEICRFWASTARYDAGTGRFSIQGVMGPDEFHEKYPGSRQGGLKDNAYTNLMVAWMLARLSELLNKLDSEKKSQLLDRLKLSEQEMERWEDIRTRLALPVSKEGIIAQFDGYFELEELDWDYFRKKYGNVHRMDRLLKAEGKSPDAYKVAKQADTLMVFYNLEKRRVDELLSDLGYKLPEDYLKKNLDYYLQRTSHGSTLSRVVHASLAKMTGKDSLAWQLYFEALTSDYNDIQGGTTAEGIHTGVMAGTVMVTLNSYAGIDLRGEMPAVSPALPEHWKQIGFKLRYRGVDYRFELSHSHIAVTAGSDAPVKISGKIYKLQAGKKLVI